MTRNLTAVPMVTVSYCCVTYVTVALVVIFQEPNQLWLKVHNLLKNDQNVMKPSQTKKKSYTTGKQLYINIYFILSNFLLHHNHNGAKLWPTAPKRKFVRIFFPSSKITQKTFNAAWKFNIVTLSSRNFELIGEWPHVKSRCYTLHSVHKI